MTRKRSTSPWIYVGCGCLTLILIVVAVVVGGGFVGYSKMRGYVEDLNDPERRNVRALELLGADQMPEGYFTLFFVPVPWVFDFVMLTDSEAANQTLEEIDQEIDPDLLSGHIFFYLRSSSVTDQETFGVVRRDLGDGQVRIEVSDQRFISRQQIGQGTLTLGRQELHWTGHRGAFEDERGEQFEGIYSVIEVSCNDNAVRSAVWFQSTTEENVEVEGVEALDGAASPEAVEAIEIIGSPAHADTLEEFMGHFDLCAK